MSGPLDRLRSRWRAGPLPVEPPAIAVDTEGDEPVDDEDWTTYGVRKATMIKDPEAAGVELVCWVAMAEKLAPSGVPAKPLYNCWQARVYFCALDGQYTVETRAWDGAPTAAASADWEALTHSTAHSFITRKQAIRSVQVRAIRLETTGHKLRSALTKSASGEWVTAPSIAKIPYT